MNLIIACNNLNGIGLNGKLPWYCREDLLLFREKTMNSILILGRKTADLIPKLQDRIIFVISKNKKPNYPYAVFKSVEEAYQKARTQYPEKKIFIAGGGEIYKYVMTFIPYMIDSIHVSHINNNIICDTYFNINDYISKNWNLSEEIHREGFVYQLWSRNNLTGVFYGREWTITERTPFNPASEETQYLNLLKEIVSSGDERKTRNGITKSLFGKNLKFDLRKGFPLLTTKKMFLRGIVEELLFFIRGETNSKKLEEKGVNIWRGNTSREFLDNNGFKDRNEGLLGPLYGFQWRFFGSGYNETTGTPLSYGYDQLQYVIDTIRNDPTSRRIVMTDYNPCQASQGVLYPCHSLIIQFYVYENFLDMTCYNRSQDVFLGTPFNIASSALLLTLISKVTGLTPRFLHLNLGDVHIYKLHENAVDTQIIREPYSFPQLVIKKDVRCIRDIEQLTSNDICVENYLCHAVIKAEMVA
jgi:dihydrofolate reductase/thymidylate synthase